MKAGFSIAVGLFALALIVLLFRASAKAADARKQRQSELDATMTP